MSNVTIQNPERFDCIVIGGGPNGLACAVYLARAGRSVCVVEKRALLGGFATTEAPFSNHPDVRMSMTSLDLVTAKLPPSIIDELSLGDYGLELIDVDPFYSHITPDGSAIVFWRDIERTCAEIARLSPADADAYRAFTHDMIAFWTVIVPYLHSNPLHPAKTMLAKLVWSALRKGPKLARAARTMMMSPAGVLRATFENASVRAALSNFAAGSAAPIDQPGSGLVLALMAMQHEWGVSRPVGGMGAFTASLAKLGEHHGVRFVTGSGVRRIYHAANKVCGVELDDGRVIAADDVIGAIDPKTLMLGLLPAEMLPPVVANELAGMTVFAENVAPARVDLLIEGTPQTLVDSERAKTLFQTTVLIGPADPQHCIARCAQGYLDDDIPVWASFPTMLDATLAPAGQNCIYAYLPAVPYSLAGAKTWHDRREELGDKVVAQLETVMPGLGKQVLARSVRTPEDIEHTSGLTRGCMNHADVSLGQMGPWRPVPSLAGYATGVAGLWHTGAGAHPMPGVNGIAGKLAAEAVLKRWTR